MRTPFLALLIVFTHTFTQAQTTVPSLEPLKVSVEKLTQELNKLNEILDPAKTEAKKETICGIISLKDERLVPIKSKDKTDKEILVRSDEMKSDEKKFKESKDITKYKLILIKGISLKITDNKITDIQISYMYNVNGVYEVGTSVKKYTKKQTHLDLNISEVNDSIVFALMPDATEYIYLNDILDYDDSLQACDGINMIVLLNAENNTQKITK